MSGDSIALEMLPLFQAEAASQAEVLNAGLLALEREPTAADQLERCMRAAHSLKGAARIVGLDAGVRVTHAMEDVFVAAQEGRLLLTPSNIDRLLAATDLLLEIANTSEGDVGRWDAERAGDVDACLASLVVGDAVPQTSIPARAAAPSAPPQDEDDRILRVTAEHLDRLLGLAGESLVESRWISPFSRSLLRVKRLQADSCRALDALRAVLTDALGPDALGEIAGAPLADAFRTAFHCQQQIAQQLTDLELFDQRSRQLSQRMYDEAVACRMRPFADVVAGFPRMVRDVAHALEKQVRLEIGGESTQVDRDVLAKLEAPLGHLLRNAVDHGVEAADARVAAGKPAEGTIRLDARHSAGMLQVIVSDDGGGVDIEKTRETVVARKLIDREAAARLSEAELLEFLFLPGFTIRTAVTDISGRGVGLDVVQDMVKGVRGTVRISSARGKGTKFTLQLPVTLSVARTLLADVGGEPYAFPLASITRTLKVPQDRIQLLEGRQHFEFGGTSIGIVTARQALGLPPAPAVDGDLPVIVIGDQQNAYGLVVDRFMGERELVVQPLDVRLGKVKDISAAALLEDGSPVLIVDADDLIRSMEKLVSQARLNTIAPGSAPHRPKQKRVLVVDDSLTVRELERKLLGNRGYDVEVAVDGMDGWNAVRTGHFDLVVTDIDMPRMDGIELVSLITKDPMLHKVPVVVVSYKDRDEERRRGLDAGASYYLTKSSFHDDTFVQAVIDLIGEAA
jgi:two-component system, chemotaxis family, sensor histidine kinase and response regulator WspE